MTSKEKEGAPAPRTETKPETVLYLTRTFKGPRDRVFKAWTDPWELKGWFAPSDDFTTPEAEVDLRPGGRYSIAMKSPGGHLFRVVGYFKEVKPPERLVYTWAWETGKMGDEGEETLVTVEFRGHGDATEVLLTHERFSTREARDEHAKGWTGCLERLGKLLARGG
jgi:uncharacterized protein YndB with AHSA1/START domain